MKKGALNLLIGGPAGAGIEKSGRTTAISFLRGGYFVFANVEHMSQIRGGNNYLRLRIDEKPHASHVEEIDIMIALDKQTVEEHIGEVVDGGAVIYDSDELDLSDVETGGALMVGVPLKKMATEELGNAIMANVISLGLVSGLVKFDVGMIKKVLGKVFEKKGAEVIKLNEKAADMGYELAGKWANDFHVEMSGGSATTATAGSSKGNMFIEGNDAFALGALKAGCKYVGEYPMTPSSSILHFMAKWAEKYGVVVKHTEDEISACNSAIGAGFAGVRALTATSGGGFALMGEAIGLAGMNEVPCVIANVMRPGPATGLPTRTDQGDLRQVIHAGQGDPVKLVLLPGSVEECFYYGFEAFNLAEKYQLPVIVCFDKHLGEGYFTVPPFDESGLKVDRGKLVTENPGEDYKRYLRTEDGISPRTIPGVKGGIHRATSDEHDEYGDITEDAENRNLMVEKRMQKVANAAAECPKPELIGDAGAEVTFVTWGSSVGICKEAAELHGNANVLQIKTAYPFHAKEVKEILEVAKRPILVEHNFTGQMGGLIAEGTGIIIEEKVLRYDGRPMTAKYIIDRIK
ncbi:MAG: 2-oxoacid:acceptor oxidoreductase subunit alpha [Nitrospirota bacterium]